MIVAVVALTLAACGSDDSAAPGTDAPASAASTVGLAEIEGLGAVLTDAEGRPLYTADEEAERGVVCTGACEEFWAPLVAGREAPTAAEGVDDLGVPERPDGSMQVTFDGRRLYTFTQDPAGEVTGDGFSDIFGGQRFTWHAVVVDGAAASSGSGQVPETTRPSGGLPGY